MSHLMLSRFGTVYKFNAVSALFLCFFLQKCGCKIVDKLAIPIDTEINFNNKVSSFYEH
jgi:hypothetical protein